MTAYLMRRFTTALIAGATVLACLSTPGVAHADFYPTPYEPLLVPGPVTGDNWGWQMDNPAPKVTAGKGKGVVGDGTGDGLADIWGIQWDGRWSKNNHANGLTSFFRSVAPYKYQNQTHIDVMKYPGDVGYDLHNATAMVPTVDWNGDGWADFLVRQDHNMYIYYNQGGGLTSDGTQTGGYLTKGPQIGRNWDNMDILIYGGHLNGDAANYVVARDTRDNNLYGYTMGAGAQLSSIGQIGRGWGKMRYILAPGQMVGDAKDDLVAIDKTGTMICFKGLGLGKVTSVGQCGRGWNGFDQALIPGDMDGDGLWDLVSVGKLTQPTQYYSPTQGNSGDPVDRGPLYLYKNLGNGHWGAKHLIGYDFYQYNVLG